MALKKVSQRCILRTKSKKEMMYSICSKVSTVYHKVTQSLSPHLNWDPLYLLSRKRVCPPGTKGWTHSPAGEGIGG
jgi:hypothetical protein